MLEGEVRWFVRVLVVALVGFVPVLFLKSLRYVSLFDLIFDLMQFQRTT